MEALEKIQTSIAGVGERHPSLRDLLPLYALALLAMEGDWLDGNSIRRLIAEGGMNGFFSSQVLQELDKKLQVSIKGLSISEFKHICLHYCDLAIGLTRSRPEDRSFFSMRRVDILEAFSKDFPDSVRVLDEPSSEQQSHPGSFSRSTALLSSSDRQIELDLTHLPDEAFERLAWLSISETSIEHEALYGSTEFSVDSILEFTAVNKSDTVFDPNCLFGIQVRPSGTRI